jgi:putative Holliday junction resolvase
MKHLSIDLGEKRIGIAVSDEKGIVAKPLTTIDRTSDQQVLQEITAICDEKRIETIVIGIPLSATDEVQERFRSFAEKLRDITKLPIEEWDETFSTKQAQNVVAFADSPSPKKKTRTHRDDVAAAVILQEYLNR